MTGRLRTWLAHLFAREGFRGPVLTLLSGNAVALGASYLAGPILTRLYAPEAFGVSDYFVMLLGVLVTVASLRYEDALMIPERDEEAAGVLGLALALTAAASVLLAVLAATAPVGRLLGALGVAGLAPWLWLVAPTLFFMRLTRLLELWLARRKRFRLVTAGDVSGKLTMTAARLGAGFARTGAGGLIGGFAAAQVVPAVVYVQAVARGPGGALRGLLRASSPAQMGRLARRFVRFPLFTMPATLLRALVTSLPVALLPVFFSAGTLGHYGRAATALAVPLSYVGHAVSQVFFVHAAEAQRAGTLGRVAGQVHARLVTIGLFPALALVVAGPDLFSFVFGEAWRVSGVYARYTAPWLMLASTASPLTRILDVLERQRTDLVLSVVMFVVLGAALVAGGRTGDPERAIALAGLAGALVRALHVGVMLRLAGVGLRAALAPYARYAAFSLPGLALAAAALPARSPLLTTAAVALGGGLYAGLVLWKDRLLATRRG